MRWLLQWAGKQEFYNDAAVLRRVSAPVMGFYPIRVGMNLITRCDTSGKDIALKDVSEPRERAISIIQGLGRRAFRISRLNNFEAP